MRRHLGFTLAELLVSLLILGEIATFTIPKIMSAQQNGQYNAVAKETVSMVSAAFQQYQLQNSVTSGIGIQNITQYMNYVAVDNATVIDDYYTGGTITCGSGPTCLRLHNGATLAYWGGDSFAGTGNLNAVPLVIDPNGKSDGSTTGPSKAIVLFLYTNGRISDKGSIASGTTYSAGAQTACPSCNPPWFKW